MATKNIVLRKEVGGVLYDLNPATTAEQVAYDSTTSVKSKIDTVAGVADLGIKHATYSNNTIKFYTQKAADVTEESAPAYTFNLPEEMLLDQAKTAFVNSFNFTEGNYTGATDPNLDGKPVLVLAVKGDTSVTYSFVNLENLIDTYTASNTATISMSIIDNAVSGTVNISAETGNQLEAKSDGLYVKATDVSADLNAIKGTGYDAASTKPNLMGLKSDIDEKGAILYAAKGADVPTLGTYDLLIQEV